MDKSFTPQLPLFDFFKSIMHWEKYELEHRSVLTAEAYELLVEGLKNCPFPLDTPDDYYRLCKFLWFKPFHADAQTLLQNGEKTAVDATFRQKFDNFWTDLTTYVTPKIEAIKPIVTLPTETVESRDLADRMAQEKEKKELSPDINPKAETQQPTGNELTDFWVSFEKNTEGGETTIFQMPTPTRHFSFLEKNQFLPLDIRRLYQMLLTVRRISFDGERSDWDFEESLNSIIRQGYLTEFAYRRQPRTWLGVHLLLDYGGSMVAFDHFSDLMSTFVENIGGENSFVWYCHNTPTDCVFRDKDERDAVKVDDWLNILEKQSPAQILIFSDGGAARGYRNPDRITAANNFLDKLRKHRVAWVNPMPRDRWSGTTAEVIEQKVAMFDATDANFVAAMQAIKGK
jgi:uncharacterized protein